MYTLQNIVFNVYIAIFGGNGIHERRSMRVSQLVNVFKGRRGRTKYGHSNHIGRVAMDILSNMDILPPRHGNGTESIAERAS